MYNIHDVLIPVRFICFILQLILTICALYAREDHILAGINNKLTEDTYNKMQKEYVITVVFFFIFELVELFIIFSGYTLFSNKLSVVQIVFHSITVLLLNWFIHEVWESKQIILELFLGGVLPVVFEVWTLCVLCSKNKKITKIR